MPSFPDILSFVKSLFGPIFEPTVTIAAITWVGRYLIGFIQCFKNIKRRIKNIENMKSKIIQTGANNFARRGLTSSGQRKLFEDHWESETKDYINLLNNLCWQGKNKESEEIKENFSQKVEETIDSIEKNWIIYQISNNLLEISNSLKQNARDFIKT